MYPLKFYPILKTLIWGGEKIIPYKNIDSSQNKIGESWELSGVYGNESVVANGSLKGFTLPEVIKHMGAELLGNDNYQRYGNEFPILIKLIDAKSNLSIQVHPNDELAAKRHNSNGKAEMWYIVNKEPEAALTIGFNKEINIEEYKESIKNNTITDYLQKYNIEVGDCFYLPPGTVHSIGAGAFILEIQQTSNITYRIYDYNRKDSDGNYRELHTKLAIDAIDFNVKDDYKSHYVSAKNSEINLVSSPYFTTSAYEINKEQIIDTSKLESFVVVICISGDGILTDSNNNEIDIKQGETILLAASNNYIKITPSEEKEIRILTSYII